MRSPAGVPIRGGAVLSRGVRSSFCLKGKRLAKTLRRGSGHLARIMLVMSLLANSTPAAPRVLGEAFVEWRAGTALWLQIGPVGALRDWFLAAQSVPRARRQERQSERAARVRRIAVYPGDVTVSLYEHVFFSAVALDGDDRPVGGVGVTWSATDEGRGGHKTRISRQGEFEAVIPGTYKVTAEAAGAKGHVTVTVLGGARRRPGERPRLAPPISSRKRPAAAAAPAKPARRGGGRAGAAQFVKTSLRAAAPAPPPPGCEDEYIWNGCNYTDGNEPDNRRGNPPGVPIDQGAGNGNFQISAPLLTLPGRGSNISLGLTYNSRVWTKSDTKINYDIDQDWPAPGWSFGFGRIVGLGLTNGGMIVDADGTRHSFAGPPPQVYSSGSTATLHTTDGTFIDYTTQANSAGIIIYSLLKRPDGTTVYYGAPGAGAVYPTAIVDADGNFINVTYVNNAGPRIQTVTDTLGRTISFHYDANNLLTAVVGPGLDGDTRTLVRLHYTELPTISSSFVGLTPMVRDYTPWALDSIYYPATGSGFWFGDSDSYNSYGVIQKVIEQVGMGFSASSLNEQGAIAPGAMTQQRLYEFQLSNLTDAPTFTSLTESYSGMDTTAAVTTFLSFMNSSPRTITTTLPNNTKTIQYSFNHPGQYDDGLVYLDETRDADGNLLRKNKVEWEQGAYDSARPVSIATTDERGQQKGAEFSYGSAYNQVLEARSYDYGYTYQGGANVLLQRTVTQYHPGAGYVANHVFNLPTVVETYDGAGTRLTRTDYQYDGATPPATPNGAAFLANLPTTATHHDETYDPYAPLYPVYECAQWDNDQINCLQWNERWTTNYLSGTDYRGKVTQVINYSNAAVEPAAGAITETRSYDITGNVISASASCCQLMSFEYTEATQYAYPESQTRGSATDALKRVKMEATYDFNTGLVVSAKDANGRISTISYYPGTLRPQTQTIATGARTEFSYDDVALAETRETYLAPPPADTGALTSKSVKYMNGAGGVKQERALGAGGVWDIVDTKYDKMGRLWKQTRPYRNGDTPLEMVITYDALGRKKRLDAADGSGSEAFYNDLDSAHPRPDAASSSPGETTLLVDPWGRERWGRTDALGRLVEVVEPRPDGDGSVTTGGWLTVYAYDAAGRLTSTSQGGQTRTFAYDSLSRLIRQKLAEATATLDDSGNYVGAGDPGAHWSEAFSYDDHSNLTRRVDARGVVTNFNYNDPLNRLLGVTYDLTGPHESLPNSPIAAAPSVTYTYRTKANAADMVDIEQTDTVTATGSGGVVSAITYLYDTMSRIGATTLSINGRPTMRTDYTYDTLNRRKDVIYPAQNLATGAGRKTAHMDYDSAGSISGLKVDGTDFASQVVYNAAGQAASVKVGTGANQVTESYDYDAATGLLSNQKATRVSGNATVTLLDLTYEYLRQGTTSGRTGQLTKLIDNLDAQKGRSYTYDALGRLTAATGGGTEGAPLWTQSYSYDRWGNRTGVTAAGFTAEVKAGGTQPRQEVAANHAPPPVGLFGEGNKLAVSDAPDSPRLFGAAGRASVNPAVVPGAPTNLRVTQVSSATQSAPAQVTLAWDAPAGAIAQYRIERRGISGQYTFVANVGGAVTTYVDTGVDSKAAYLYRVRATDTIGSNSAYSNIALGTAYSFADDPIITAAEDPSGATVTKVKATHITQLREAINAVRALVPGLGAATWTQPTLTPNQTVIMAEDVRELRTALGAALSALGLTLPSYTDPTIYNGQNGQRTIIKRDHIKELRLAATRGSGGASGGQGTPVPADGWDTLSFDPATNRINTTGWEYDAAGNQTRARVADNVWRRYEYDAANRLVKVLSDDRQVTLAVYTYGSTKGRLMAEEGGLRTYYSGGDMGVMVEYTEALGSNEPQWSKSYVYLGVRLLSVISPSGGGEYVEFYHPDRLGTRLITNSSNEYVQAQSTLPYGTVIAAETSAVTRRHFTSYDRSDATGLDYAVNRYYDPLQGRFTQVDPIGMSAVSLDNPQTLNLYTYCGGDPVNRSDPKGLFWGKLFRFIGKAFKWIGIILAVAAIVVTAAIIFAPAGSFIFKAAVWILMHVLIPISQLPILGAMVPLHGIGTPTWNPGGRKPGLSWQEGHTTDAGGYDEDGIIRIYTTIWELGPPALTGYSQAIEVFVPASVQLSRMLNREESPEVQKRRRMDSTYRAYKQCMAAAGSEWRRTRDLTNQWPPSPLLPKKMQDEMMRLAPDGIVDDAGGGVAGAGIEWMAKGSPSLSGFSYGMAGAGIFKGARTSINLTIMMNEIYDAKVAICQQQFNAGMANP